MPSAFWIAYILTRPLGASTGDLLSQSVANGDLGFRRSRHFIREIVP